MARGADRYKLPELEAVETPARRKLGPMAAAGREVAENVAAATEAQVEARRRNAADAKEWRAAAAEGRVLMTVPLEEIAADDLPRDRLGLAALETSEEMEELKASIRARGQREPVELYRDAEGRLQLKKGWRRVAALRALHAETGENRFATALARIDDGPGLEAEARAARIELYVDMVEENAVREDLTFAEMANLALEAVADPRTGLATYEEAVGRLYGSLARMKRSNIRRFVTLMRHLGDALPFPKAIGRDLGADLGRRLEQDPDLADRLRDALAGAATPERQNTELRAALRAARPETVAPSERRFARGPLSARVTVHEMRIRAAFPIGNLGDRRLEAALDAFLAALDPASPAPADPDDEAAPRSSEPRWR